MKQEGRGFQRGKRRWPTLGRRLAGDGGHGRRRGSPVCDSAELSLEQWEKEGGLGYGLDSLERGSEALIAFIVALPRSAPS